MTGPRAQWTLPGAKGELIHGETHSPDGDATAAVVLVHGFKGYKDYGMLVHIAGSLADVGCVVHRVSLSHSGMGHGHGDFNEALFERDTWNRGIEDLLALNEAIDRGDLAGAAGGVILVGHSRGGALSLAAAGRHVDDGLLGAVRGVASLSAPARLNGLDDGAAAGLLAEGRIPSPSSRTGQVLHVGVAWVQEQLDDPEGHDMQRLMGRISVPVLLIHGADDPTVPASDAALLQRYGPEGVQMHLVAGGTHVFNTPNPFDMAAMPSPQLADAEAALLRFVQGAC